MARLIIMTLALMLASSFAFAQAPPAPPPPASDPYAYLNCDDASDATITIYDEYGNVVWEGTEKEACEHLKLKDLCRQHEVKAQCQTEPLRTCVVNDAQGQEVISGHCKWTQATYDGEEIPGGRCDCVGAPGGIAASPGLMFSSLLASLAVLLALRPRGSSFPG